MKLYEVPRNTWIKVAGIRFLFHHIDGMYSLCIDEQGSIINLAASTEVEIDEEKGNEPKD